MNLATAKAGTQQKQCKLCLRSLPNLAKAHVIPKSFYEIHPQFGDPMRIISSNPSERSKRSRIGVYDEDLVCHDCEKSSGALESAAFEAIFGGTGELVKGDGEPLVEIKHVPDISRIRRFIVALLWKMDNTQRPEFGKVRLGRLASDFSRICSSATWPEVPFVDAFISRFDEEVSGAFLFPIKKRLEGVNGYHVCFSRHQMWIKVDRRPLPEPFSEVALSRFDHLRILRRSFIGSPEFLALAMLARKRRDQAQVSHPA